MRRRLDFPADRVLHQWLLLHIPSSHGGDDHDHTVQVSLLDDLATVVDSEIEPIQLHIHIHQGLVDGILRSVVPRIHPKRVSPASQESFHHKVRLFLPPHPCRAVARSKSHDVSSIEPQRQVNLGSCAKAS